MSCHELSYVDYPTLFRLNLHILPFYKSTIVNHVNFILFNKFNVKLTLYIQFYYHQKQSVILIQFWLNKV